jgi:hypothetical protein
MRGPYNFQTDQFRARLEDADDGALERRPQDYERLHRELLDAERQCLWPRLRPVRMRILANMELPRGR